MPRHAVDKPGPQAASRAARYRFGRFELQPPERRLLCSGSAVHVNSRAFDLIVALVERAGALVPKDELLDRVWPKLVVEESNLHVHVSALRKILGPEAIETVPGHGYRFTLDVAEADAEPAAAGVPRHNLPRQLTSLIGRERDLEQCARLLTTTRLLTITGVGGLGKTRLSLALAENLLPDFVDGVWFVELAALSDPRLVPLAVASVFGIMEQPGTPVLDSVAGYVSNRCLLVILDNCEHLRHSCAQVAQRLLQAGPKVKVVTSSREPLHVPGEATYPLSTLAVPDDPQSDTFESLAACEAVQLFVDRATAAHPAFRLSRTNARTVGAICAQLDGIPLALELAAARVRVVAVDAIAQRLDDRFRLLKGGDRTALPRQQTLLATIEWSHDLLTERERRLLARLAVFSGGWTLDAAEAVCSGGDVDAADVLDQNGQLIEKSLAVMNPDGTRYRMLETVRQFALERLDASGESDAVRGRHLAYFVALAEEAERHVLSPDEGPWTDRIEIERDNLRAAYAWCGRTDTGGETGLRLASTLAAWLCRGYFDLGEPVLAEALARPGVQQRNLLRCRGLLAAGFISYFRGRYDDARRYGEDGLAIAREIGASEVEAGAMTQLGLACQGQGDLAASRRYVVDALALARVAGNKRVLLDALNSRAELHAMENEIDAAESLLEEALAVSRELGTRHFTTIALLNLAKSALVRRSPERAREFLRSAFGVFEEIGSRLNAHALLAFAAGLAVLDENWLTAARFLGASDRELELLGLRREPGDEASLAPLFAEARDAAGAVAFAEAQTAGRALDYGLATAEARKWIECRP